MLYSWDCERFTVQILFSYQFSYSVTFKFPYVSPIFYLSPIFYVSVILFYFYVSVILWYSLVYLCCYLLTCGSWYLLSCFRRPIITIYFESKMLTGLKMRFQSICCLREKIIFYNLVKDFTVYSVKGCFTVLASKTKFKDQSSYFRSTKH